MNTRTELDLDLFHLLAAGDTPFQPLLSLAQGLAHWSWLALVLMLAMLLLRDQGWRILVVCLAGALLAQWLARQLALEWNAPRPFMLGLAPNHLDHGERGGLPSTHATVMFAVFAVLWRCHLPVHWWTCALVIALATGWARIHGGAHFPLDILAGAALGTLTGYLVALASSRFWRVKPSASSTTAPTPAH